VRRGTSSRWKQQPVRLAAALCHALILLACAVLLACDGADQPPPAMSSEAQQGERPNFIIIDIDTLNASRVGARRGDRPVTPHIDRLAQDGVSFDRAFSNSGWTLPALTALLTGRYPVRAQVGDGGPSWKHADTRTLPEILAVYGYHTAVFWGAEMGAMGAGVSVGFDDVHVIRGPGGPPAPGVVPAPVAVDGRQVRAWLEKQAREPFFLLVHEIDLAVVGGGIPADRWHTFSPPGARSGCPVVGGVYQELREEHGEGPAKDCAIARYDSALNHYDEVVGLLLTQLEEQGLRERTVVILLSDHGQDLFEHAAGDHGILYDSVLRTPLILSDPSLRQPGREVSAVVQTIDVAPSILERAGIPVDQSMDGRSWLSLTGLSDGAYASRPVLSYTNACNASIRTERHKLLIREYDEVYLELMRRWNGDAVSEPVAPDQWIETVGLDDMALPGMVAADGMMERFGFAQPTGQLGFGGVTGHDGCTQLTVELYDLAADPGELHNLALERHDLGFELGAVLLTWMRTRELDQAEFSRVEISEYQRRIMQERGYWELVAPRDP
jgi:hypothetical protein